MIQRLINLLKEPVQITSRTSLKKLRFTSRHIKLAIAFAIAPLFWALLYFFTRQVSNLSWPFLFPREYLTQALIFPILEEVVFRKILQGYFYELSSGQKSWHGISNANILASLIFGCTHLIYHSYIWAMAVLISCLPRPRRRDVSPNWRSRSG